MKIEKAENEAGFSNEELVVIISAAAAKGASTRMKALGCSMSPFIMGGDIITLSPLPEVPPEKGKVAAFTCSKRKRLTVHRIVKKKGNGYLIKGDNCGGSDRLVPERDILGIVSKIERDGRIIRFGLGRERYIIAFLSGIKLLPSVFMLWRVLPFKLRRTIKCLIHT
ncbi:MAG: S24/S26 family peptidase [Victivallaceae bacterium]|nr:S24/S26 family peptidase [Victivallaceae bacterium]